MDTNSEAIERELYFYNYFVTRFENDQNLNFEAVACAMATAAHESQSFRKLKELSYTLERAKKVWPARFVLDAKKRAILQRYGSDGIFEIAYGGRMGNNAFGDGMTYIGRGIIMTTGKDGYKFVEEKTGYPVVTNPGLLEKDFQLACEAFCVYWEDRVKMSDAARGDIQKVTLAVNGGLNGLPDRLRHYDFYFRKYIPQLNRGE